MIDGKKKEEEIVNDDLGLGDDLPPRAEKVDKKDANEIFGGYEEEEEMQM